MCLLVKILKMMYKNKNNLKIKHHLFGIILKQQETDILTILFVKLEIAENKFGELNVQNIFLLLIANLCH